MAIFTKTKICSRPTTMLKIYTKIYFAKFQWGLYPKHAGQHTAV